MDKRTDDELNREVLVLVEAVRVGTVASGILELLPVPLRDVTPVPLIEMSSAASSMHRRYLALSSSTSVCRERRCEASSRNKVLVTSNSSCV